MSAVQSSGPKADGHVSLGYEVQEVISREKKPRHLVHEKDNPERLFSHCSPNTLESVAIVSKKQKIRNFKGHVNNNINEKESVKDNQLHKVANIIDLVSRRYTTNIS